MTQEQIPVELRFDLTGKIDLDGEHSVAASLFVPPGGPPAGRPIVLFCLHGGSYNRSYYDMRIPGRSAYSFARDMAARGFFVVTVDDLGVGESSRPEDELSLTMPIVAAANAEVAYACVEGLQHGTLTRELAPLGVRPRMVGLGHSMGGMLTIFQQARWGSFDAVGILGFSPFGWGSPSLELKSPFKGYEDMDGAELLERLRTRHVSAGYLGYKKVDASKMRFYHHWDDVPEDVMAAEDAAADCLPGITGVTGQVPGLVIPDAEQITCPVYIHWAEREPFFFDPLRDATLFKNSRDVTVFVQPRSGHSHNLASTRMMFWNRLAGWVSGIAQVYWPAAEE